MDDERIDEFATHNNLMQFLKHSSTLAAAIAILSTALFPSFSDNLSIVSVWMTARALSVWGMLFAFLGYFFGTMFRYACKDGAFGSAPFRFVLGAAAFASGACVCLSTYTLAVNKEWRAEPQTTDLSIDQNNVR